MIQGKKIGDKYYCSSPFNSIFLDTYANVSSCCAGTEMWGDLRKESIEDIINSEIATNIRNDVRNGDVTSYCSQCSKNEKDSTNSQRGHFDYIDIDTSVEFELKTLDVRWSNICNFSCIYCNEDFSSTWAKKKSISVPNDNLKKQEELLDYIEKNGGDKIKKIMMAGGEPLLQTQNNKLVDLVPNDTQITIISNMGVDLKKSSIFKKLSKMPNITWSISMENVEDEYEYIRQGGNWEQMKSNIKYIKSNTTHIVNLLSIFNSFTIPNISKFINFAESNNVNIIWQPILFYEQMNPYKMSNDIIKYYDDVMLAHSLSKYNFKNLGFFYSPLIKSSILSKVLSSYATWGIFRNIK